MSIYGSYHASAPLMHCRKTLHLNPGALVRMLGLMKRAAMVLVMLSGCASTTVTRGALLASMATLACDWGSTHRAAADEWMGGVNGTGRYERNPIMGETPNTTTVNLYFAAAAAANVALWLVLPQRYRAIVPVAVVAAEAHPIAVNVRQVSVCGL